MKLEDVSFDKLPVNSLFQTYVKDYPKLSGYFSESPFQWPKQNGRSDFNSGKVERNKLITLLNNINTSYGVDKETFSQIKRLEDPESRVVVTGQQMVVLGGPLFLVLKAISVLSWAKYIERQTGKPVVPVFWLADEDHDLEEVSTLALPGSDGVEHLHLDYHPKVRHSVGVKSPAGDAVADLINRVFEILPETDFSSELDELLRSTYQSGNLKEGFGRLMARLFSKHGLVLAESNNSGIKEELSRPICQAVQQAIEINDKLEKRSAEVENDFHRQAQVQPTTLFMHDDNEGRIRLNRTNGKWWTDAGGEWTTRELCRIAEEEPWRFSPNVFLRPIIQDWLLPTVGYVAGPGEVAYYAQLGKVYELFDQKMPVILPRYSASIIEPAIHRIMDHLPFELPDFARRIEDLEKEYLEWSTPDNIEDHFLTWQQEMESFMQEKSSIIEKYDPSLRGNVEKMTVNFNKSIEKLHQKLRKSLRQQDEVQLKRINRIKNTIFPEDQMQERVISWLYFSNKYGLGFWDEVIDELSDSETLPHKHLSLFP